MHADSGTIVFTPYTIDVAFKLVLIDVLRGIDELEVLLSQQTQ